LHVDVAARKFFRTQRPQPTHRIAEVRDTIGLFEGCNIKLRATGAYYVARKQLPSFVQSATKLTAEVGDVSIRTVGGTLSVSGAPIDTIRWWIREGERDSIVQLEAHLKVTTIHDSYLEDCLSDLNFAFDAFVVWS
jgi:hypothetical protein